MKRINYFISLLVSFVLIFGSCTLEKRLYMSGYHVDWKNNSRNNKQVKKQVKQEVKTVELAEVVEVTDVSKTVEAVKEIEIAKPLESYNSEIVINSSVANEVIEDNSIASSSDDLSALAEIINVKADKPSLKKSSNKISITDLIPKPNIIKKETSKKEVSGWKKILTNGVGIGGMVLAILSLIFCWLPIVNWILWAGAVVMSGIGLLFEPKGFAIAGLVISLIPLIIMIAILVGLRRATR